MRMCFKNLIDSYPFQVYIEVSKNHNIPVHVLIREKFRPENQVLLMYYNNQLRRKQKEYEKMEEEMKQQKKDMEVNK